MFSLNKSFSIADLGTNTIPQWEENSAFSSLPSMPDATEAQQDITTNNKVHAKAMCALLLSIYLPLSVLLLSIQCLYLSAQTAQQCLKRPIISPTLKATPRE